MVTQSRKSRARNKAVAHRKVRDFLCKKSRKKM
nr:MAG TPA: hypothetical protein [Caudoviricetes sp.]DAZ82907.1 MAG TPA: hypothetical protein [Caudoviricetes sp.]